MYPVPAFAYSSTATTARSLKNTESTRQNWPQLENCSRLLCYWGVTMAAVTSCYADSAGRGWSFRENAPWCNASSSTMIYCWLCPVGRVRRCTEGLSRCFSLCKKCLILQVFKCKRSTYLFAYQNLKASNNQSPCLSWKADQFIPLLWSKQSRNLNMNP